ncbi:hypothetical protein [Pseudoxanthomonas beigongshangi]
MKRWWLWGLCALLPAQAVEACGLNTHMTPFELQAGATPSDAAEDSLRAPELKVTEITRGLGGAPGTCDGSGLLGVRLEWPRGDYKLEDIGFEFRVVSADSPYALFPAEPVRVISDSRRAELLFLWPDDAPGQQKPLRIEVEVRAVTRDYRRGPVARFSVDSTED